MSPQDIATAREWAEKNAGEDNPLDLFAWKLLELMRDEASAKSVWWERRCTKSETIMSEFEARFVVSGGTEDVEF